MLRFRFWPRFLFEGLLVLIMVSCSSTEKTEPPKPAASIDFEIENLPFSIYYDSWYAVWYCNITIVIYERAGVGASVSVVKSEWFEGSNTVASSTDQGGRVPPSGSLKVKIYSEFPGEYQPDRYRIAVSGRDDNGHNFQKSYDYTITWDSGAAVLRSARDWK